MQHDMQHEHFPCKFTINVQDLTFAAQPRSYNGKCRFLSPRALFLEISKEKARVACRVACVLHVRCMGRATQITSLNWGSGKSVAGTRILGDRREILEAENLRAAEPQ